MFTDIKKTRVIVDLDAIASNYLHTKELAGDVRVAAVVKADAYGHGALPVARALADVGCDFFAVATIDEALALRADGISGTILVLGYVLDGCLGDAIENGVSLAVDSTAHLERIIATAGNRTALVHLKLDTGMNRTGFSAKGETVSSALWDAVGLLKEHPNIRCEGVFSHFPVADETGEEARRFTEKQFRAYQHTVGFLREKGIVPTICHICNSAGILNYADMHLDAVRAGICLYGLETNDPAYRPAMQFKTIIVNIHTITPGESVGYGLAFTADTTMRIAVIGAGYADGLKRCLSSGKGYVLCHGKKAPILGRVCMDMTMIDITDIPEAVVGDDAVIFGESEGVYLSAEEVAACAQTISYEILCSVSKRVPRLYSGKNNK